MKRYHWSKECMIEGERGSFVKAADASELEKRYADRINELALLAEIVCSWALKTPNLVDLFPEVKDAANNLMDFVDTVRP